MFDHRVDDIINLRAILRRKLIELLSQKRIFYQIPIVKDIRKDHIR